MAGPLVFAVGAGALAGTAFAGFQEHQRRKAIREVASRDDQVHALLADPVHLQRLQEVPQEHADAPVWLLLLHLGEAYMQESMRGRKVKIYLKYGARGWSLKRESQLQEVMGADKTKTEPCAAYFNETLVFLWRRGLQPVVRLRLAKAGSIERTIGRTEFHFRFTGLAGHHEKTLRLSGSKNGGPSTLRIVAEMRCMRLGDLRTHGLNVGQVVQQSRLGAPEAMVPLVHGVAVSQAPGLDAADDGAVAGRVVPSSMALRSSNGSASPPLPVVGSIIPGSGVSGSIVPDSIAGGMEATQVIGSLRPAETTLPRDAFENGYTVGAGQRGIGTLFTEAPSPDGADSQEGSDESDDGESASESDDTAQHTNECRCQ